ncbi:hypothetical protein [Vibrio nereis]|uniref:hypothetical protein n=1 Tax=Vibrio nereis TaxID=693 RepID=UPI0024950911|nr:hypothetical protein [Vibrio nereis]
MKKYLTIAAVSTLVFLGGCANEPESSLGYHMAKVKSEQTYNPNATRDNMHVIPDGNGERMEDAYSLYTGKKGEELKGSSTSQVIKGF